MRIFKDIKPLRKFISDQKHKDHRIGLVPTMGALHEGHLALVRSCVDQNDITVCTIYVNPAQFDRKSDLTNYPRPLQADLRALKKTGCQVVFTPDDQVMYPASPLMHCSFGPLENTMEGVHRPGHFRGVALIVAKLLNIVQPHHAYFGQKDWQQVVIIRQLVKDLCFPLQIIDIPIVREKDGLAMSSRNSLLSKQRRKLAPQLYRALQLAREHLKNSHSVHEAREAGIRHLDQFANIRLEYLEIVDLQTLQAPSKPVGNKPLSICLAANLGKIRLIDNVKVF